MEELLVCCFAVVARNIDNRDPHVALSVTTSGILHGYSRGGENGAVAISVYVCPPSAE